LFLLEERGLRLLSLNIKKNYELRINVVYLSG
jgi:hypothetical protein